ncbi:MAG: GNAT family N-acetyltransferase [Thermoanaerobaculaceae bacterium]
MYWRLAPKEWTAGKEGGNREALRALVASGTPPGVLAYDGTTPVGWCAVGPRSAFPRLERSKILAPVDDLPVWSLVCFFVAKAHRRLGVSEALLRGAIDLARKSGAPVLEAYPVVPQEDEMPDAFRLDRHRLHVPQAGVPRGRPALRQPPDRPVAARDRTGHVAPDARWAGH